MRIVGIMSGTSLDGIDVALLDVVRTGPRPLDGTTGVPPLRWELVSFRCRPYTEGERRRLQDALTSGGPGDLARLHSDVGELFANATLELLEEEGIAPDSVAAVGSHGQTVWHDPPRDGERGRSLQLGCPATIAERTGIGVVSDFRSRDLAAGGHGAPLVPWADQVFFSSPDRRRALQNLGGIGNVTWLPALPDAETLLAFDTGPGVVLLNLAAELASGGAMAVDMDGKMAVRGQTSDALLEHLLADSFFGQPPPRSTGRERFGQGLVRDAVRLLGEISGAELIPGSGQKEWDDLLATLTALTARSIGDAYRRWVLPRGLDEAFLTGGGARNPELVRAIEIELDPIPVRPAEELGMDPDAREAAAFALLAWAHVQGIPASVQQATGADGARVLGSWTPGRSGRPR